MKKILFITTGGTISCGSTEGGLAPQKNGGDLLRALSLPCTAEILDLYSIDSTDLTPKHLKRLFNAVSQSLESYDGIVILHGTDTMAYTGAFLALTLGSCKPVILTGSMLSADENGTDVWDNICFAAQTACRDDLSGVWLAFCGRVIAGSSIHKLSCTDKDAFCSYSDNVPSVTFPIPKGDCFPSVIKLTPFTSPSDLLTSNSCGAVIETYGTGGLPENGAILSTIRLIAKKKPVIITTPCLGGTDLSRYEVGRRALDAGAVSSYGMSTECAAVYLWLKNG